MMKSKFISSSRTIDSQEYKIYFQIINKWNIGKYQPKIKKIKTVILK